MPDKYALLCKIESLSSKSKVEVAATSGLWFHIKVAFHITFTFVLSINSHQFFTDVITVDESDAGGNFEDQVQILDVKPIVAVGQQATAPRALVPAPLPDQVMFKHDLVGHHAKAQCAPATVIHANPISFKSDLMVRERESNTGISRPGEVPQAVPSGTLPIRANITPGPVRWDCQCSLQFGQQAVAPCAPSAEFRTVPAFWKPDQVRWGWEFSTRYSQQAEAPETAPPVGVLMKPDLDWHSSLQLGQQAKATWTPSAAIKADPFAFEAGEVGCYRESGTELGPQAKAPETAAVPNQIVFKSDPDEPSRKPDMPATDWNRSRASGFLASGSGGVSTK